VHASDANPILVITQLQPITALFTLPEDQLQIVSRQMGKSTLPVEAYSRDDQTKLAMGKLLTIDNQIDQTTGTGRLKAVFDNKDNQLWPNQFVNVHLLLETRKNAVVIPSAAVQHGPQGNYVYVVKPDKTVEVREVNIATTEGNVAQIAGGISPSDTVVTDGQDKLQNGSRVEPHQQVATQPPAGTGANPNSPTPGAAPPAQGRGNHGGGPRTSGTSNSGIPSR
jgi:multidrug efflux system membrane fusion protein